MWLISAFKRYLEWKASCRGYVVEVSCSGKEDGEPPKTEAPASAQTLNDSGLNPGNA